MDKKDLRIVKTKELIHLTLINLLKKKKLSQIKITELCREANINRGTFYFHYEEITDVFKELFTEIIADLKESYYEPYKKNEQLTLNNLNPDNIRIFHHIKRYEEFYRIVLSEEVSMKYYYMLFDAIRNIYQSDTNYLIDESYDTYVYSYQVNAIMGLIIEWYRNNFSETADTMNLHLFRILNLKNNKRIE